MTADEREEVRKLLDQGKPVLVAPKALWDAYPELPLASELETLDYLILLASACQNLPLDIPGSHTTKNEFAIAFEMCECRFYPGVGAIIIEDLKDKTQLMVEVRKGDDNDQLRLEWLYDRARKICEANNYTLSEGN